MTPIDILRDVEFGKGGGRPLRLHFVRPRPAPSAPLPVVVYLHGGGWLTGSRDDGLAPLSRLASKGFLGASVEYRFSSEAKFPAQIEDCKCAVRFLRGNAGAYGIDAGRIGVWGFSAGAHLAALLGTAGDEADLEGSGGWPGVSSRVQAVVDFCGPTDFLTMGKGRIDHDAPDSPESHLVGGPIHDRPAAVRRANPFSYVTRRAPPFLIVHGDQDDVVPLGQSALLHDALRKAGVDSTFRVLKGQGHVFQGAEEEVEAFLERTLKSKPVT